MAVTGDTQLAPTKQDIIAASVQRELKENSYLANYVLNVSNFAGKGMKSISFPKLSSFTVEERASGAAGTIQDLTSSVDKLDLDKRAYISWLVDSNDEIQSTIDFQTEAAMRAASAHGRYVDNKIIEGLIDVASLSVNGAGSADITRDNVLAMRRYLIENNANMNNAVLVIPPDQEEAMLKIDSFTRADIYGSAVIPSGIIGKVYNIPVMVHNSEELDAQQSLMFEKEGFAIGFQRSPNFDEQKKIEYGTGAMLQAVDQLFGVKGLQLGVSTAKHAGVPGKSPLVAKLKD